MNYHPDYITSKRKMVKRYIDAKKFWIIEHIEESYDDKVAAEILKGLVPMEYFNE